MKFLIFSLTLVSASLAAPQGYGLPAPYGGGGGGSCGNGQVQGPSGGCVSAQVNSRVFLFEAPPAPVTPSKPYKAPPPKVERNIVFVRLPEGGAGPEPIVIPPPRQEHVVYVLNKQSAGGQQTIEVPASPPSDPEVYFVNYAEGENPSLPIGVDLQTALNAALQGSGQVVGGGGNGGGFRGGFGGGSGGGFGGGGYGGGSPSSQYGTP